MEDTTLGKYSVLFVDDDRMARRLYTKYLTRAGYEVLPVDSGEKALAQLRKRRFDLMVLDLVMPSMSGIEVLEELRKDGGQTPIILVLTAEDNPGAVSRCFALGAVAVLGKPVSGPTLRGALEDARLGKQPMARENAGESGNRMFLQDIKMASPRTSTWIDNNDPEEGSR